MKDNAGGEVDGNASAAALGTQETREALLDLEYLCTDVDNAGDFSKMGGLDAVSAALRHRDCGVRHHAAWLLGTMVRHSEEAQVRLLICSPRSATRALVRYRNGRMLRH